MFSNTLVDLVLVASAIALGILQQDRDARPSTTPRRTRTTFRENPRSHLPDSESVLIGALLVALLFVSLNAAGIDVVSSLETTASAHPLEIVWLVVIAVGSKVVTTAQSG